MKGRIRCIKSSMIREQIQFYSKYPWSYSKSKLRKIAWKEIISDAFQSGKIVGRLSADGNKLDSSRAVKETHTDDCKQKIRRRINKRARNIISSMNKYFVTPGYVFQMIHKHMYDMYYPSPKGLCTVSAGHTFLKYGKMVQSSGQDLH